jgi:hypothetical protein
MKYVSLLLITLMLVSCATTTVPRLVADKSRVTDCDLALPSCATTATPQNNAEYMAASGTVLTDAPASLPSAAIPAPGPTPPQVQNSVSGWEVLGALVLIPLALIAGYGSYGRYHRVTCRSYVYKDDPYTTCY